VNLSRINVQKYAERPAMAKALCDYMLHVEHAPKRAAELAAAATAAAKFKAPPPTLQLLFLLQLSWLSVCVCAHACAKARLVVVVAGLVVEGAAG
jgi:hypothetical protein